MGHFCPPQINADPCGSGSGSTTLDAGGDGPGAGGREGGEGGPRGGLPLQAGTERVPHLEPTLVLFGLQQGNDAYGNEIRIQIALIDIPKV